MVIHPSMLHCAFRRAQGSQFVCRKWICDNTIVILTLVAQHSVLVGPCLLLYALGRLIIDLVTTVVRGGQHGHDVRSQKTKSKAYTLGCKASNGVE